MQLRAGEMMACYTKDQRHTLFVFGVEDSRLARQVVGPRLPRGWYANLEDEALDDVPAGGFDSWWVPDVVGKFAEVPKDR